MKLNVLVKFAVVNDQRNVKMRSSRCATNTLTKMHLVVFQDTMYCISEQSIRHFFFLRQKRHTLEVNVMIFCGYLVV